LSSLVAASDKCYPCLYADSKDPATFAWVNRRDAERSVISFIRRNPWNYDGAVLALISFSPKEYPDYTLGVPMGGLYTRVFSTYDRTPSDESTEEIGERVYLEAEKQACDGCCPIPTIL